MSSTALTKRQEEGFTKIKQVFQGEELKQAIAAALPKHITAERMIRVALTSFRRNPKLLECQPASVIKAVMEAAQLGLEVDGILGHAYLVPYGDECQLLPGYRGLIELARRSGEIALIKAGVVRRGDDLIWEDVPPSFRHTAMGSPNEPVTHVYAWIRLMNGQEDFCCWPTDTVEAHRKRYSRAGKNSPWETAWEWMAKKTVIRQLLKLMPVSIELQSMIQRDEYHEARVIESHVVDTDKKAYISSIKLATEPDRPREPGDEPEDGELFDRGNPDAVEAGA